MTNRVGLRARLASPYDREILSYAVPALGSLAAQPLYVLVDTAIVGHLGSRQLAALGVATTVLFAVSMFNFLQYATTAQVARARGAGEEEAALRLGAQTLWLSLGVGVVLATLIGLLAAPLAAAVGAEGETAGYAVTYLRIIVLGLPGAFLAIGGQGFLRGVSELRLPLVIVAAGNGVNVVLEVLFVYGFGWDIAGSAWGTVIAQTAMGLGMAAMIIARIGPERASFQAALARRLVDFGRFIFLRTIALACALIMLGTAAAHLGDAANGAYQVGRQVWLFLGLLLDAIAIAGQIIVGRELGAGRPAAAFSAGLRTIWFSIGLGLAFTLGLTATASVVPLVFTADPDVLAACATIWPIVAFMQPFNGAVFALDGILIGASDGRYIALAMIAALGGCAVILAGALALGLGLTGVWLALAGLIAVRLTLMASRFARRRWAVTGFA